ncbi:hypothetical protein KC19_5G015500 [Ceratodon purpureus]|uniref:Stress-response A/B barrel domain-containing protein n=1 Tax=Ceratodon purpureus TaxID=3225 RepID=A0A8T0HY25_CERPU|nr:hypothetical protein KC19_5G015500 [Ceratodon purpureus]
MDESDVVITSLGPVPSVIDAAIQVMESKTRKICEHFVVMRLKNDVDPQQEAEMLDVLWSLQFHFDTILALSIGKLVKEKEGWTHALHIRFESKEAWDAYLNHPILKETEIHCQQWLQDVMSIGFEADVDNHAESIHQNGKSFENGTLEHVLCMEIRADTSPEQLREMEEAVGGMPGELGPSIIVQFTRGPIINASNCHFTYALMARLTSGDALKQYVDHPYHQKISNSKVRSICSTALSFDYVVDARSRKRKGIYGAQ